jgi:hypothetical protein
MRLTPGTSSADIRAIVIKTSGAMVVFPNEFSDMSFLLFMILLIIHHYIIAMPPSIPRTCPVIYSKRATCYKRCFIF